MALWRLFEGKSPVFTGLAHMRDAGESCAFEAWGGRPAYFDSIPSETHSKVTSSSA